MGCGASKLKGEDAKVDDNVPSQPIRKVESRFRDVDYNGVHDSTTADPTADRAPDELDPPPEQSVPTNVATEHEDAKLEPYKSITEPGQAEDPVHEVPKEETADMIR